jgi:hypothetical protein
MNEIQQSLPLAKQLQEPLGRMPRSQYLRCVPVELLPLMPDSDQSTTHDSQAPPYAPPITPFTSPPSASMQAQLPQPTSPPIHHPSHLSHLPNSTRIQRARPSFTFLPLLDTPPSTPSSSQPSSPSIYGDMHAMDDDSELSDDGTQDPPISPITESALDNLISASTPPSPASLPNLHLPPPTNGIKPSENPYFPPIVASQTNNGTSAQHNHMMHKAATKLRALPSPMLIPPSPLSLYSTTSSPSMKVAT